MHEVNIGATIARERSAAGVTQGALAAHLGVTKAAVSKWELGQSLPDVALLPRIAAYFGITLDELFAFRPQLTEDEVRDVYLELCRLFAEDAGAAYARMDELVRIVLGPASADGGAVLAALVRGTGARRGAFGQDVQPGRAGGGVRRRC